MCFKINHENLTDCLGSVKHRFILKKFINKIVHLFDNLSLKKNLGKKNMIKVSTIKIKERKSN